MRKRLAFVALILAVVAEGRAVLTQLVTIATNDPHAYQGFLKEGLLYSVLGLALSALFVALARSGWRFIALVPVGLAGFALWGIHNMWPYAFS